MYGPPQKRKQKMEDDGLVCVHDTSQAMRGILFARATTATFW